MVEAIRVAWVGRPDSYAKAATPVTHSKPLPTFADALAAVRRALWQSMISNTSKNAADTVKLPRAVLNRLTELACYPA